MIEWVAILSFFNILKLPTSSVLDFSLILLHIICSFLVLKKLHANKALFGIILITITSFHFSSAGATEHSQILYIQVLIAILIARLTSIPAIDAARVVLAGHYITAALTKIKNSSLNWFSGAGNLAFQMVSVHDQKFYADSSDYHFGQFDTMATFLYQHPYILQLALIFVFFVELNAWTCLLNKKWRKLWGFLTITIHLTAYYLFTVLFLNNISLIIILCFLYEKNPKVVFRKIWNPMKAIIPLILIFIVSCTKPNTEVIPEKYLKYQSLNYRKTRSRPIERIEERMAPYSLLKEVQILIDKNEDRPIRILEIGQGNGRVLLTLMKNFPSTKLELYGINKEPSTAFTERSDYVTTALKFEIFSYSEINSLELPKISFVNVDNGNPLPFKDGFFDIIFSQSTMQHIQSKFELLNENLRILRVGGVALHTSFRNVFIYESNGKRIALDDFFEKLRKTQQISITRAHKEDSIYIEKTNDYRFKLVHEDKLCSTEQGSPVMKNGEVEYYEKKSCYQIPN